MHTHTPKHNLEQHNFVHLVWDVAWFGIAWVTVSRFLQVYAIRVGASPIELGWITAGPQLGMLIASLFSVWWRERHPDSMKAIFYPTLLFRFSFLLLAFTPLFPQMWQPLWLIISVTLPAIPQGVSSIIFFPLLKEATPDHRMTDLFGRRTLVVNLTLGLGTLGFGLWLERIPYPYNYALMFAFAFAAALMSQWHLNKVQPLDPEAAKPNPNQHKAKPLQNPRFRRLLMINGLSYVAFFSVFPVIVLRLVDDLGASEGFMAVFSVIELAAGAALAVFIPRLVRKFGNQYMAGFALLGTVVAVLIIALTDTLPITLLAALFTGAGWSTAEIGMLNHLAEVMPTRDAARYTRVHSQTIWTAIFIAPFIGTYLVSFGVSITAVLFLGAGLRIIAALIALDTLSVARPKRRARVW